MSTDLRDLMEERADRLPAPDLDVAALMAGAERHVRRRRVAGVAGAAVLGLAAAWAGPALTGASDGGARDGLVADGTTPAQAPLAWVRGSVLHTSPDGPTLDLGHQPVALVQGDSGFVVADAEGVVRAVIDGEVLEVGRLQTPKAARFEADGDVVAWVDAGDGTASYAALDLSRGPGTVSLPVRQGHGTPLEAELGMEEAVAAVDGDTVYLRARNGAHAWRPFAADDEVGALPVPDGARVVLHDAKAGVLHYARAGGSGPGQEETYVVGPDLASGVELESWDGILSPDGRYLVSETADENLVSDTSTGRLLPFDLGRYGFVAGYRWLDEDTYAALGIEDPGADDEDMVVDLLRCEAAAGACETVVQGESLAGDQPLILPFGDSW